MSSPNHIALDRNNPDDLEVIDRLVQVQQTSIGSVKAEFPETYLTYEDGRNGNIYYSYDGGKTYIRNASSPYSSSSKLDPDKASDKQIIDNLRPVTAMLKKTVYVPGSPGGAAGATISTQEAAQKALVAIDNAIVSKDTIRAHLGALQNRLENTISNLSIQAENMQASESRISDTDVATEMTAFVRNQILTESATAMLSQANSFPHMLMNLLG